MANDPTVKAGSWGARTVEKIVRLTEYALRHELPVVLAGRLGRRPHHRPGRALPRAPRRGPHLLQPGAAVGAGAADLLPVRPVGRRRRVHPELLRHRDHGRGQRVDVPRLAAHGRDGDRRDHDARGDGRRAHARHRVGLRRQPRRRRRRRHRSGQGVLHRTSRRRGATSRRAYEAVDAGARAHRRPRAAPTSTCRYDMHDVIDGIVDAEIVLRDQAAVRAGADRRARPARRPTRSASSPTTRRSKGGVLFVDSADKAARFIWCCDAFNIPLVFLADVPGFMVGTAGRAPGHHPPRRQDDHRRVRGDGAQGLGDRAQGVRRRALRDVRPGVRARGDASPCPPPRSR